MIPKSKRIYIRDWFDANQEFKEGDILEFEMPSFCSGDYEAEIHIDTDGDPYISSEDNYIDGCRSYFIQKPICKSYSIQNTIDDIPIDEFGLL